ncbi:NUDIX hydrolase [Litorivita pollutaquae]|uniref:NUDIX hydrolase n=1 Tax=Litorivita pollutaquae TaxID=2200892 RepID=A0A2V4N340_9RHOB|nr:NUDIX hydrolase [Litorivita pollutaquae]OUS20405.1 NUDIX hydrolase [Rhodobacterales bacterium 59_46_T64]PYC49174.1 NUDIX hydrolase [Litorivita pollutaquae]
MTNTFRKAWREVVSPIWKRPKDEQVAALCYREDEAGDTKVLLVTSRTNKRWILPKGWPIDGLEYSQAAMQEAWEEAGVKKATAESEVFATFKTKKVLAGGLPTPIQMKVYKVAVAKTKSDYPEAAERERKWVSPETAAEMVDDPRLSSILRTL